MDEAKMKAITEEEVLPLAKQMGYSFTMDDLKAYCEVMQQANVNCELSDSELEAVVGGGLVCVIVGVGGGGVCVFFGLTSSCSICFISGCCDW